jgi:hypothetical protein
MKLAALWLGVGSIDCGGIVAQPEPARRHGSTKSAKQPLRLHVNEVVTLYLTKKTLANSR